MAKYDLANLDTASRADEGAELTLLHPGTGEELDVVITLNGMDSAAYRKAEARLTEKYRKLKGRTRTPDDLRRDSCEILASCTVDWRNVQLDGAELPCTHDNAKMLYQRMPWIYEQGQAFIAERSNYLRDLPQGSAQQ